MVTGVLAVFLYHFLEYEALHLFHKTVQNAKEFLLRGVNFSFWSLIQNSFGSQ